MRRALDIGIGGCIAVVVLMAGAVSWALELEPPSEDGRWIKVETANFTVFSNADPKIANRNAVTLEQLRAVLARHFDEVTSTSPVPSLVWVFDFFTDAYPPFGPFANGKPRKSGGYLISRQWANYVAIVERDHRYPNRMEIYNDYVHAVLEAELPALPLWLREGFAEYYSIFHIEDGEARVGYRINRHIARIRNQRLIPLVELFAIDESSPEYDEQDRHGVFFAESWLLTHMLVTERPGGRAQALRYAELLREGVDRDTAFTEAFETTVAEVEAEFRKYVRARSYHYKVFPVSREIIATTKVTTMSRAEVLFRLGDLLCRGRAERLDFAAELYEAAVELDDGYDSALAQQCVERSHSAVISAGADGAVR
ncbi:MAG: hypothetical protein V2I67_05855 [Thermoanaerobaculales bacterium]|jgi:hypothetical protein|nr:hypothetical protein [Thermoanaerobaculales bacterium]